MTSSAGLLEFYILEAGEYIDRLDALVASAGVTAPDADAIVSAARALRGSSTMAKMQRIAELAGYIERIGRAVRPGGGLGWT